MDPVCPHLLLLPARLSRYLAFVFQNLQMQNSAAGFAQILLSLLSLGTLSFEIVVQRRCWKKNVRMQTNVSLFLPACYFLNAVVFLPADPTHSRQPHISDCSF